jgi:hypothetical protein
MILALQGDTIIATLTIENKVKDIQNIVHDKKDTEIRNWLKKTDQVSNHTAAQEKHEEGTGIGSSRLMTFRIG